MFSDIRYHGKALRVPVAVSSIVLLILVSIVSLGIGSISISIRRTGEIIWDQIPFLSSIHHFAVPESDYLIITELREPQIVGAIIVGSTLAVGGSVVQSIFRNPITEPYIIGISSGAALGAVLSIALSLSFLGYYTLEINAFLFSTITVAIVYLISYRHGRAPPTFLLLIGISLSFFSSSIVSFIIFSDVNLAGSEYFWLLGSIETISWSEIIALIPIVLFSSIGIYLLRNELDALQMGDEHAHSIGVNVERTRAILIALVTLSTSAVVSVSGLIGFVGLIMPHVSRLVYGGSNRYVIPTSAVFGSIFLMAANDISKVIIHGEVIPIGIVTGIIGVPVFIYLLGKMAKGSYVQ
ncbi:FecCD family ABC transporter permease [Thermoplasma acidophilum]|uniref:FecCD family ABC transporter permease n=1 Tax=Thermoplasma acidophilum TaxID=2303 RepID=UPI001F52B2C5|nr:iron ABC transporter permease [Thermoplasma acidophilum]